jgi:hypothetical protein
MFLTLFYNQNAPFFIDNIFARIGGGVFQQTVGIHMGTNTCSFNDMQDQLLIYFFFYH